MANEIGRLEILLEAQTAQFSQGMNQAINQIKRTQDQMRQQGQALNSLNGQFKSVTDSIGLMTRGLAALGGLGYLKGLIDAADAASDMGDAFGIAIGRIYGMSNAIQEAGGKGDGLQSILQKLSNTVDDAFEGNEKARESFLRLGITMESIASLSIDQIYQKIAKALAGIEDPAKRNAIAMDLMGKSAVGTDWAKHNKVLEETRQKYEDMTPALQRAADYSEKLAVATKQLGTIVTATLGAIPDTIRKIGQGFKDLYAVATGQKTMAEALAQTGEAAKAAEAPVANISRTIKATSAEASAAAKEIDKWNDAIRRAVEEQIAWESKTLDSINPMREVDRELAKLQVALDSGRISWEQYADAMFLITEKVPTGLKDTKKELDEIGVAIGATLSSGVSGLVDVFFDAKKSFGDFAADFLKQIAKMIAQLYIMKALKQSTFFGQFFANGGAFTGNTGLPQGVYTQPTVFPMKGTGVRKFAMGGTFGVGMLGEAGPEAIMPLKRGKSGKLGVEAAPVNIVINNDNSANTQVTARETTNEDGGRQIEVFVEKIMKSKFADGSMDKTMRANYGAVRQGY